MSYGKTIIQRTMHIQERTDQCFCKGQYLSICDSSNYSFKFVAHLIFTSPPSQLGNYHISTVLRAPGSLFVSSLCFAAAPSFVSSFFVAQVIKVATIAGKIHSLHINSQSQRQVVYYVTWLASVANKKAIARILSIVVNKV